MKPDGSEITILDENSDFRTLQYDNGYLYYGHNEGFSRIPLAAESGEPEVAFASFYSYIVDDGWIYCNGDGGLRRISFDGVQEQLILQEQPWYYGFAIASGFIYTVEEASDDSGRFKYWLRRVDISEIGAGIPPANKIDVKWRLEDEYDILYIGITGAANGYLYYEQLDGGDLSHLQRMKYNGTGNESVELLIYDALS